MSEEGKLGFWARIFGGNPPPAPAPGCCCCSPAMEPAIEDAKRQVAEEKRGSRDEGCCSDSSDGACCSEGKGSGERCCG
jgi:hypothetical protein